VADPVFPVKLLKNHPYPPLLNDLKLQTVIFVKMEGPEDQRTEIWAAGGWVTKACLAIEDFL
jgi:hypothetical protein